MAWKMSSDFCFWGKKLLISKNKIITIWIPGEALTSQDGWGGSNVKQDSTWNVNDIPNPSSQRPIRPPRAQNFGPPYVSRPQNSGLPPKQNGSTYPEGSLEWESDNTSGQMSYGGGSGRCIRSNGWDSIGKTILIEFKIPPLDGIT